MQERVLKSSPGVIIGMSTNQAYRNIAIFYDGKRPVQEVDLTESMPSVKTEQGMVPGLELNIFCRDSIIVKYPENARIEFFYN